MSTPTDSPVGNRQIVTITVCAVKERPWQQERFGPPERLETLIFQYAQERQTQGQEVYEKMLSHQS